MSGKKNSKKARNGKNSKKLRVFAIVCISIVALIGSIWGITSIVNSVKKKKADRTVRIAFYGISEDIYPILQDIIPKEENIELKMDILSDGALDLGALKQKYDMLFTWKGEVTDALQDACEDIPAKILDTMPSSLKNKKCAPIILDHFEFTYSRDVVQKTTEQIPLNYAGFLNYLEQAKKYVFTPFFCHGGDDRTLCAFVGAMIEAMGGMSAYNNLISKMREESDFEALLDFELNNSGLSLRYVLDTLKTWPKEGLTHPSWYNGNGNDLLFFAQEDHIGVFFTTLTEHRKIPYQVISKYEAERVPMMSSTAEFGLIAPALCGMLLSDNENAKRYLAAFFTEEAQVDLSDKTKLAPVHSRAQAYDRQADDVRFWAASCPGGALPDLYLAVFQRNPAAMAEFAKSCRAYVR